MKIHELSARQLRDKLDGGEISSTEIVDALHVRSDVVNSRVNALVVESWDQARAEAARCDAERKTGTASGALHGLPFTVKESIEVEGTDSTLGFVSWKGRIATASSGVVEAARKAGGFLLGKTNVPQTLLSPLETTNAIWGATKNPWNVQRAVGGSSGGEAAALAAGISVLGIGTDVGGSIRLPAAFTGTAGLKPTWSRWSNRGSRTAMAGQEFVRPQTGPMARTADDVAFLFEALDPATMAAIDPRVPPVVARTASEVDVSKLRIGVFDSDGFIVPSTSVRRAVLEAERALEGIGATIVPFVPPHADEILYTYLAAVSADGGATVEAALAGESVIDPLKLVRLSAQMPRAVRLAIARGLELTGDTRTARLLDAVGNKDVRAYWKLTAERNRLMTADAAAWDAAKLDAIVCPIQVTPALPHGMAKDFILSFTYAARYNLLDHPAGVVPVTCVRPGDSLRESSRERLEKRARAVEEKSEGLPIGVQVVGRPWQEHVVLAVMIAIENAVREHPDYPKTPITPHTDSDLPPKD